MRDLLKIYKKIGLSKALINLTQNTKKISYLDDYKFVNDYWYPHPPCLLPLFLGHGASYKGINLIFFDNEHKHNSFVEYFSNNLYFSEIARNENQLFSQMVLEMDMVIEGINEKIKNFCEDINFKEFNQVDEFAEKFGNIKKHYESLIFLDKNTPLMFCNDINKYNGSFLSSLKMFNEKYLKNSCSFELCNESFLKNISDVPKWFDKNLNKKDLFNYYYQNDELLKAWLTLNSTGWVLRDVKKSLELLKEKTDNKLFHLVADNWINGMLNYKRENESY